MHFGTNANFGDESLLFDSFDSDFLGIAAIGIAEDLVQRNRFSS